MDNSFGGVFSKLEQYKSPLLENNKKQEDTKPEKQLTEPELFIKRVEGEGFDMREIRPILTANGNEIIVSCAGSGKTTTLVFKIQMDIVSGISTKLTKVGDNLVRTPANILVSTFSREATLEIKNRLRKWQAHWGYNLTADTMTFKTLHAEFKDALLAMGINIKIDNTSKTREVCKKFGVKNIKSGRISAEDCKNIESIITYARNRLDNKRYSHQEMQNYGITPTILDAMLNYTKTDRRNRGVVDFEDCQEILYDALKVNPNLSDFLASRYEFFYIDEFQDISQIQYEILKHYMKKAKKIVVVGDDDQGIYDWRGSDVRIMLQKFPNDYKPTVHNLSTNFRCPDGILNPVVPCINRNTARFKKDIRAYKEGGTFDVAIEKTILDGGVAMMDNIVKDIARGYSVAVLVRDNYDGVVPAVLSEVTKRVNYRVTSDLMTLNTPLGRSIMDIAGIFLDRCSARVLKVLKMLVPRQDEYHVDRIFQILRDNSKFSIWNIPIRDIEFSVPSLANVIKITRNVMETKGEISAYLYLAMYIRDFAFEGDSSYCEGAKSMIDLMVYILSTKKFETLEDFDVYIRSINQTIESHMVSNKNIKLEITTIHQAKGREWDSVYLWKTCTDIIPSYQAGEDIEPERKLFYIAVTRAKKKFTAVTMRGKVSEFLYECNLPQDKLVEKIQGTVGDSTLSEWKKLDGEEDILNESDLPQGKFDGKVQNTTNENTLNERRKLDEEGAFDGQ